MIYFLIVECKPLTAEQKYDWLNIAITEFRDVDLMKEIISEGVCVNIPDPNPRGFEVKMLLAHGADPYCLIHGLRPVLNEPFSWDCFEMAKVFENEEVISYFSGYKVGRFAVVRVTFECSVVPFSLNEFQVLVICLLDSVSVVTSRVG